ncbi:MAG: pilus assembly protein PilM [Planctomycetota bacterium]|jgi:type IV pilus assembly protein PilM
MAKSVGLDIHPRGVRAVEVTGGRKNFRITRYMERSLTPRGGTPDPEELREALTEIFRGGKFSKHNVVTAVEAHDTVVREISVPFKADDQIRKVVKYEAEHHLHDCDADDVIVQYTKVGESGDGTNLLVFAARKESIGRRIEYARSAGVEPLAMDLDALAAYYAVRAAGLFEDAPPCVLLEIGHRSTGMIFVVDGEVRALRSVRMGVDSIAQSLARDMDIDFSAADHKLSELSADEEGDLLLPIDRLDDKKETEKSHHQLERDLFHHKRDEFVARLKREFIRSSAALRGAGRPERILVTGAGLQVPGLLELLGQRLGTAIDSFRPSEHFPCKVDAEAKEEFDAGAAVALGLALKGIGKVPVEIDFRQEELQVANKFELLKNSLAITVTLVFIGLLAFSFYCVIKKRELQDERFEPMLTNAFQSFSEVAAQYNQLGDRLIEARYQVDVGRIEQAGERPLAVRRFINELRRMKKRLHRVVGDDQGLPPLKSALQTWNEIFGIVNKNHEQIGYIDFESIFITQERVRFNVVLPSIAEAENYLEEPLKKVLPDMELDGGLGSEPAKNTDYQRVLFNFRKKRERRGR